MFLNGETKAPSQCLNKFHHDLLLNFSEESLFGGTDRTFSNIYVELPYPVVKPKDNINASKDIVISLLDEKNKFLELLQSKRRTYKYDLRHIVKKKIGENKFIYLPKHLLEFYQKKDPDKYFHGDYNYYYTDGVLASLEIEEKNFLLYPDANNDIFLLDAHSPSDIVNLGYKVDSPVHNICTTNNSIENPFVVREKYTCHILNLDDNKKCNFMYRNELKVPILDAKLNSNNVYHMGIVSANGNLNVNDIETNRTLLHYKALLDLQGETCDNFQRFSFFNNNSICLMDRYNIKLLDYRTNSLENSFDPKVIKCNPLCNFKIIDNMLLLASRHYIMKTDLRYLQKATSYSHTLSSAPCYMDFVVKNEDIFLAVAGQHHDSKVLFTGNAPYSLPYKVPSLTKTLEETILWDPTMILHLKDFEHRLKYSIAGLKILNLNGDICIFTSNSLGEIYKQKISDKKIDNSESLQVLSNWLKIVEIPEPTLHLTLVEEMSGARFALNTAPIKANLEKYKKESKVAEFLAKYEPRYNKKNVSTTWARKFTSIWEDSDETDEEDAIDDLPEIPVVDKVEGWILENEFAADLDSSFKES